MIDMIDKKLTIAVVITKHDRADLFTPETTTRLEALGNVKWNPHDRGLTPDETAEFISDADICINCWNCVALDEPVIRHANNLKLMACIGASVRMLATDALYERGVVVISANPVYAESVAEGTLGYIIAGLRRIPFYNSAVKDGRWHDRHSVGSEGLIEKTVGLMGFGAIAQFLTNFLKPFRVKVLAYDPFLSDNSLFDTHGVSRIDTPEALFSQSQILSVHLPLTPETIHIIEKNLLRLLPDNALLVNTSRGSIIDEKAMVNELRSGRIHAVLDVFQHEPLPKENALCKLDNVILMPHMGGPTNDRLTIIGQTLLDDIERFIRNEPLQLIVNRTYAMHMTNDALGH